MSGLSGADLFMASNSMNIGLMPILNDWAVQPVLALVHYWLFIFQHETVISRRSTVRKHDYEHKEFIAVFGSCQ